VENKISVDDKLASREKYIKLSFAMLVFMVLAIAVMAFVGIIPATITAVATGFIGLSVSFAGIIASHFGFSPKDTKK